MKYILVSGGVISGIGKGVIASSTGLLLKMQGYTVTAIKIDPYLNIDAGTMSPLEHGEAFVLDDGAETDLDLGNYERFLDVSLARDNNITTGKIYSSVIEKERQGKYLGKTVQVIPHVTNEIQDWIERVAHRPVDASGATPEVCIIELGGTVGDIESAPFVEAMRQFQFRVGIDNMALIHVSLVPTINGELKTKPTQAAVRDLRSLGLTADLIACRCATTLPESVTEKISMFTHVSPKQVLAVHDVSSLYHVPLLLEAQGVLTFLTQRLKLEAGPSSAAARTLGLQTMTRWKALAASQDRLVDEVTIALVGKYTALHDSYTSVVKSLEHAALRCGRRLVVNWIESTDLEDETKDHTPAAYYAAWQALTQSQGVILPGGFGSRGTEGKLLATRWARTKKIPFLGICLGFQLAVVEFCRSVLGWEDANSTELDEKTAHPVVIFMPEGSKTHMGGTMRLGSRVTLLRADSRTAALYGETEIAERHRHRYEVNPDHVAAIEAAGMHFVGRDTEGRRMQVFEVAGHPYFVGMQAHPEFKTRPLDPSPAYYGLVAAAAGIDLAAGLDRSVTATAAVELPVKMVNGNGNVTPVAVE